MQRSKSLLVQLSILGVGAFLGIRIAIPCSLIAPSETAGLFNLTGTTDRPLLISERLSPPPVLVGDDGAVAIDPATPDPRLAAAKGGGGVELFFFTPRDPLAPGNYDFDNGRSQFSVTASASDAPPPLGSSGRIEVFIDHDPDDGGCFGFDSGASCGNTSSVRLTADGAVVDAMYLLEFSTPDGKAFSRLVSDRSLPGQFLFYGAFQEVGDLEVEVCAKITGVSPSGALGSTLDLGCAKGE